MFGRRPRFVRAFLTSLVLAASPGLLQLSSSWIRISVRVPVGESNVVSSVQGLEAAAAGHNITSKDATTRLAYFGDGADINCKQRPLSERNKIHARDVFPKWVSNGGKLRGFNFSLEQRLREQRRRSKQGDYYRGSLHKFLAFLLHDAYDRVVVMDADGVAINHLDRLFTVRMPPGVAVAAPQAYWVEGYGSKMWDPDHCPGHLTMAVTSALLVVKPSPQLFARMQRHFGLTRRLSKMENFDMDIVNIEFTCSGELLVLPKAYCTLDAEYAVGSELNRRTEKCRNFASQASFLHFSHRGKPWTSARSKRDYFEWYPAEVARVFVEWHATATDVCPDLGFKLLTEDTRGHGVFTEVNAF